MAQETLNGLLQYILTTLPIEDKIWFIQQMEQDVHRLKSEEDEVDLLDRAVERSLEEVAAGRFYTEEQARTMRAGVADSVFYSAAI